MIEKSMLPESPGVFSIALRIVFGVLKDVIFNLIFNIYKLKCPATLIPGH
jgi:hypothetical protein